MFGVDRNIEQSWKKLVFYNFKYRNLLFSSLPYANWTFKSQAKRAISCCVFEKKRTIHIHMGRDIYFSGLCLYSGALLLSVSPLCFAGQLPAAGSSGAKTTIAFRILFFAQNVNSLNTFTCQKPSEQKPQK